MLNFPGEILEFGRQFFGRTFLAIHSAIFGPIGLKYFIGLGAQETIIYRLVMRNTNYDDYF